MKITSFMLPSLVLAAMVVTCAAGPAWAEQVPRGVQADERIKTVIYRPDDVIGLSASYGISTMVQFGESEKIETVALGNSVAWQVIPNKKGNMLFIKPVEPRAATNMNVVTDRRVYTFALQAWPGRCARPNLQGPLQVSGGGGGRAPDAGRRATRPVPEP